MCIRGDPESNSSKLAGAIINEYFANIGIHPAVEFYSLGNEYNNIADLSSRNNADGCISSSQMAKLSRRFVNWIKRHDKFTPVAFGSTMTRPGAWNLAQSASGKCVTGTETWDDNFSTDTLEQAQIQLSVFHNSYDIVQAHLYNKTGNKDRLGFDRNSAEIVGFLKDYTDKKRQMLFVGEFGETYKNAEANLLDPDYLGNSIYMENVINKIVELKVPYSAVWTWHFYQRNLFRQDSFDQGLYGHNDYWYSIEPGFRDGIIEQIQDANRTFSNGLNISSHTGNLPTETCFIGFQLEGSTINAAQKVGGFLSSIEDGSVLSFSNIEFLISGVRPNNQPFSQVITVNQYPYQGKIQTGKFKSGSPLQIQLTATNEKGRNCSDSIMALNRD